MKKMNFNHIYNDFTPDAYLNCLRELDYREPDFVHDCLRKIVLDGISSHGEYKIVDLACGYGFNGAIAKYDLPYERCSVRTPFVNNSICHVVGVDIATNALKYAHYMNFIDDYIEQNLEKEIINSCCSEKLENTNLIISSGSFSYITEKTLEQIFSKLNTCVDFVGWPIYGSNISGITDFLDKNYNSYVVSDDIYPMRSFFNEEEQNSYIDNLTKIQLSKIGDTKKLPVYKIHAKAFEFKL